MEKFVDQTTEPIIALYSSLLDYICCSIFNTTHSKVTEG